MSRRKVPLHVKKGPHRKNKTAPQRVRCTRNDPRIGGGGELVVKGVSKRVIVVKAPDPRIFEEAIFVVREDYAGEAGVSGKEALREAQRAAESYLSGGVQLPLHRTGSLRATVYAAAGAAATGLAWIAVQLVR